MSKSGKDKKEDSSVWQTNLQNLRKFKKEHNHCNVPEDYERDRQLARWVKNVRTHRNKLPDFVEKALLKLKFDFNYKPSSWEYYYHQLKAFHRVHHHVYIQARDTAYTSLYQWTRAIRGSKSKLTQAQRESLDKLGFVWEAQNRGKLWELRLQELSDFKKKHGHVIVPKSMKNLNGWIRTLRKKESRISKEKKEQLAALGFLWSADVKRVQQQTWEKHYQELIVFFKKHGHTHVPRATKLGMWCNNMCKTQKEISAARKKKLDKIGFAWEGTRLNTWETRYRELVAFNKKYGHTRVPLSMTKLHNWARSQRKNKRSLSESLIARLDKLGFLWTGESVNARWEARFQQLVEFKKKHGHTFVPVSLKQLNYWCMMMRAGQNRLTPQQKKRLSEIGFSWGEDAWREWKWHKHFNRLKEFYEANGHELYKPGGRYKKLPPDEVNLRLFLERQKMLCKRGVLKPERKKMLQSIGMKFS